jgi:4F5 protein related disordered region
MARGQQKIQSQQKAAEKTAKAKKQQGHSLADQKAAAAKALAIICTGGRKFSRFHHHKEED